MSRSMFTDSSENEKVIVVPGYDEEVVIRPLSESERKQATAVHPFAPGAQRDIYRKAASLGIVRVGDRENEQWNEILSPDAIEFIGSQVMAITRSL